MDYTVDDYNVTIWRGFVREDGKVLWGKNPALKNGLEWRTPEAYNKNVMQKKKNQKTRYQLHKSLIDSIKLKYGCEVCGFGKHKYAKKWRKHVAMLLEFDHIDPKTKTRDVSSMVTYSWRKLIAEIKKCRVLCFRCHAIHTGNQNRKDNAA